MQNDLKIHCEDPKLKLIWESVVEQINLHDTVILGVPCDLLSELSSCTPDKAACFREVLFEEIPGNAAAVGCTSSLIGLSTREPDQTDGRIIFSASRREKLAAVSSLDAF